MTSKKVALYGLLTSMMLVLGFIERQIVIAPTIPGIRLGLANTVLLYALCLISVRSTFLLMGMKVLLSGLLFAGFSGFLYSLAGGIASVLVMMLALRIRGIGIVGVSVLGSVAHMMAQLVVAGNIAGWQMMAGVLSPILLVSGTVMGVLTGVIAQGVCAAVARNDRHMQARLKSLGLERKGS